MSTKRFNRQNAIAIVCAAILVGTEIIAAALALGWAVGGLTGWGQEVTYALIGICFLAGCYLTYLFVRGAIRVEPIYD